MPSCFVPFDFFAISMLGVSLHRVECGVLDLNLSKNYDGAKEMMMMIWNVM